MMSAAKVLLLLFVLVFDMALLGALVADGGRFLDGAAVTWLLLLNPADAYRLLNLTGTAEVSAFSGTSGLAGQVHVGSAALAAVLLAWIAAPLAASMALFARRAV